MSSVTGLVLVCSVDEDAAPEQFIAWCCARWPGDVAPPPRDCSDSAGGDKHPEVMIIAAGINYACEPHEIAQAFYMCPWRWPGVATLILTPDGCERAIVARADDVTKTYRVVVESA